MDAIDYLLKQHRELEALLEQAMEAGDGDDARRLYERAADHLTMHMTAEEQVFYPAVRANRTEDILLESLEEHLSLKRVMADLLPMQPSDRNWEAKLHVLKEQAEHHHEEEEEHLFPKVRKLIDAEQRQALGREMIELERKLEKRGEPRERVSGQTDAAAPLPPRRSAR